MSVGVKEEIVAKIDLPSIDEAESVIKQEVVQTEQLANGMVISSQEDYESAAEFIKEIKGKAGQVTEFFKPMKDSAYKAHRQVCDREKQMLNPLVQAEKRIKSAMNTYYMEQERKRRELEDKLRREAEAEKERKLQEAVKQEEAGNHEAAEAAIMDAQFTEAAANQVTVVVDEPKVKGVSHTKDWEIEAVDEMAVPVMFSGMQIRPVDQKAVIRLIKASKGTIQIPGIKYKEVMKMSVRR